MTHIQTLVPLFTILCLSFFWKSTRPLGICTVGALSAIYPKLFLWLLIASAIGAVCFYFGGKDGRG